MSDNMQSRSQKNKRKNTRSDLVMKLSIGLLFLAIFILLLEWVYPSSNGANEKDLALDGNGQSESSLVLRESEDESEVGSESSSQEASESADSTESESDKAVSVTEVTSNDPNVLKSFVGDWAPIGTTQSGSHITNYDDGSADRVEIKRAVSQVTGVQENDMVEHWIGNDGEQRVTATIRQVSSGKFYKVYLSWNDGKGWQVTRYDEIREVVQ